MGIQFILNAKGCSNRAVRLRDLDADERDKIAIDTATEVGKDGTGAQYAVLEARNLITASLTGVTKSAVKDADALVKLPESEWVTLDAQKLSQDPSAPTYYAKLFSPKEDSIIAGVVRRRNTATTDEIDSILGKAMATVES